MNEQQIAWASSHDWFHKALPEHGVVICKEWQSGLNSYMQVQFSNFQALREWAGY